MSASELLSRFPELCLQALEPLARFLQLTPPFPERLLPILFARAGALELMLQPQTVTEQAK